MMIDTAVFMNKRSWGDMALFDAFDFLVLSYWPTISHALHLFLSVHITIYFFQLDDCTSEAHMVVGRRRCMNIARGNA